MEEVKLNMELEIYPSDLENFLKGISGFSELATKLPAKDYGDGRKAAYHGEITEPYLAFTKDQLKKLPINR